MKSTITKPNTWGSQQGDSVRPLKRHYLRTKQYKKIVFASLMVMVLMNLSCKKLLQEHPESIIVPSIFTTEGGLVGGIGGVYNDLRSLWGTEGFTMQCLGGTDETQEGASVTSP